MTKYDFVVRTEINGKVIEQRMHTSLQSMITGMQKAIDVLQEKGKHMSVEVYCENLDDIIYIEEI